jgi:hypothetical protein
MRLFVFIFFLSASFSLQAQSEYAKKIIADLASPQMHGRGYVMGGDSLAAAYIGAEMDRLGARTFFDQRFQEFSFFVNTFPDTVFMQMDGKALVPGKDFVVDPDCPSVKRSYKVVYCSSRQWHKSKQYRNDQESLIVLDAGGIKNADSLKMFRALVADVNKTNAVMVVQSQKFTWSVGREQSNKPRFEIMASALDTNARSIQIHVNAKMKARHLTRNVIGWIPAKKKSSKYIVVTAHYDHLGQMGSDACFYGANDNASGVAQMLTLMKYYSENPGKYNMVFIAFAGEEAGLLGSEFYVQHPFFPLKQIRFLFNLDLQGTGEEGATIVNATVFKKEFALLEAINAKEKYLTQIKQRGEAANSDHYYFTKAGVPSFFMYTMGGSKAYHDINDKPEAISMYAFDKVTTLLISFFGKL